MNMLLLSTLVILAVATAAPQNQPPVPILRFENDVQADGSYAFNYETGDGVSRSETGRQKQLGQDVFGASSQGSVSWQTPDGKTVTLTFVADENGYQPKVTIS